MPLRTIALILILTLCFGTSKGQFTIVPTGISGDVGQIDVSPGTAVILTSRYQIAASYDNCQSFAPINTPAPSNYLNGYISRVDANTVFILVLHPNTVSNALVFKSVNNGSSWNKILDTSGIYLQGATFFDTNEGILIGTWNKQLKTTNSGANWITQQGPAYVPMRIKSFGDSMVCVGDGSGNIECSNNRGNSWNFNGISSSQTTARNFNFLNKDSIFCITNAYTYSAIVACSFNGGNTWNVRFTPSILSGAEGICFRNKNLGLVAATLADGNGVILKTTDLGQSWSIYNTGIKTNLHDVAFLNDSIALACGSAGLLLKFDVKRTVFTGVSEQGRPKTNLLISPNPAKDILRLQIADYKLQSSTNTLRIADYLGRVVKEEAIDFKGQSTEFEIKQLPAGLYTITLSNAVSTIRGRFIKE